ncbi:Nramp family divalent metal transporter [Caballeronia sp. SL2Y3]|uniref:Nramp family divalent metal transporter n=1 Tax=Caballeronia sp. SL2Y3 TaxID=2878151 RepID=UPI001FD4334A|nr:Nramp family divalent metal transporter [Caballeronia sp. SL2Y3]
MKKLLEISLGIVTSIGGFLEMGEMSTTAQAGAAFHYQLLWTVVLGTVCIAFLTEMSGRFAAVSGHTIVDGIRDRFGIKLLALPLISTVIVSFLVLSAEIGGVSVALEFATGISYRWWALPVALLSWLFLWRGTFGMLEKGISLLGLVTLCFVVAIIRLRPEWTQVAAAAVPSRPHGHAATYWFMAASILGASLSPTLFLFYSSGAIEDRWDRSYLWPNRAIAALGMLFGGVISAAVLLVSAQVLNGRGILDVEDFHQLPLLLVDAFGMWGFVLFVASLGIASLGAALEVALLEAYLFAQAFGWNWGQDCPPRANPGFSLVYTCALLLAALPIAAGADPLKLTVFSMALTAVNLPLMVVPFIVLMNDEHYMGEHCNGPISNVAVIAITALAFVLGIVTIPLEYFGGT